MKIKYFKEIIKEIIYQKINNLNRNRKGGGNRI